MTATTPQLDYSDDWKWWDNTESITITLQRANLVTTTVAITDAFRGDINRSAVTFLGVEIVVNSQIWTVPASLLGGSNELRQGDSLTDADGVIWDVETAVLVTIGTSKLYWTAATNKRRV